MDFSKVPPSWRTYGTNLEALRQKLAAREETGRKLGSSSRWEAQTQDLASYVSWLEEQQGAQAALQVASGRDIKTRLSKAYHNNSLFLLSKLDAGVWAAIASHLSTAERVSFFSTCSKLRAASLAQPAAPALWGDMTAAAQSVVGAESLARWLGRRRQWVRHLTVHITFCVPSALGPSTPATAGGPADNGSPDAPADDASSPGLGAGQGACPTSDPAFLGLGLDGGALRTLRVVGVAFMPLWRLVQPKPRGRMHCLARLDTLEASAPGLLLSPALAKLPRLQNLTLRGWAGGEKATHVHCLPPSLTALHVKWDPGAGAASASGAAGGGPTGSAPDEPSLGEEDLAGWRLPGAVAAAHWLRRLVIERPVARCDGLNKLVGLTFLALAASKDKAPKQLSELRALRELHLALRSVDHKGLPLAPLKSLAWLSRLDLTHFDYEGRGGGGGSGSNSEGESEGEEGFADACEPGGYGHMRCQVPAGLLCLPALQTLDIHCWPIPAPSLETPPAHAPRLRDLTLALSTAAASAEALAQLTALVRLRLTRRRQACIVSSIVSANIGVLAGALSTLPALRMLSWEFEAELEEATEQRSWAGSHWLQAQRPFPALASLFLDFSKSHPGTAARLEVLLGLPFRAASMPNLENVWVAGAPAVAAALRRAVQQGVRVDEGLSGAQAPW